MTRLTSELLVNIGRNLDDYDTDLKRKTGLSLAQIACQAAGLHHEDFHQKMAATLVGIIPITTGRGLIQGFSQAVESIITHMGFSAFITRTHDVTGIAEGIEEGAKLIFLADDNRFVALDLTRCRVIDNAEATASGFVTALDALAGGLINRNVLVIGAGRVGRNACLALKERDAKPAVYDLELNKAKNLSEEFDIPVELNFTGALEKYKILLDASPAENIIHSGHIQPETIIAACGVPIGVSKKAQHLVQERLIHDPLQIGTAAMLTMALSHGSKLQRGVDRKDRMDSKSMKPGVTPGLPAIKAVAECYEIENDRS